MKKEIRNNGIKDILVLVADENKHFILKGTDEDWGNEVWTGYIYYKNGELLPEPHIITEEDFDEVEYEIPTQESSEYVEYEEDNNQSI